MSRLKLLGAAVLAAAFVTSASAEGEGYGNGRATRNFEVTVTNVTRGISFTPLLIATHSSRASMFEPGKPASEGLGVMAESGNTAPLQAELSASGQVLATATTSGLLAPGASVTVQIKGSARFDRLSIAGMLLPTNDGFVGLDGAELPWDRSVTTLTLVGYDAGTELNDERCMNIPGPHCGGVGVSPGVAEGFVHVHAGIHGIADLAAATYDWRNPMAEVTIRRIP